MTLSQDDHFILIQAIRMVKERLDQMVPSNNEALQMYEEFRDMIGNLRDVVMELAKELEK